MGTELRRCTALERMSLPPFIIEATCPDGESSVVHVTRADRTIKQLRAELATLFMKMHLERVIYSVDLLHVLPLDEQKPPLDDRALVADVSHRLMTVGSRLGSQVLVPHAKVRATCSFGLF